MKTKSNQWASTNFRNSFNDMREKYDSGNVGVGDKMEFNTCLIK